MCIGQYIIILNANDLACTFRAREKIIFDVQAYSVVAATTVSPYIHDIT